MSRSGYGERAHLDLVSRATLPAVSSPRMAAAESPADDDVPRKEPPMTSVPRRLAVILLALSLTSLAVSPASSQAPQVPARGHGAEARDMELVGHDHLQGRPAYQPTIFKQGGRFLPSAAPPAR